MPTRNFRYVHLLESNGIITNRVFHVSVFPGHFESSVFLSRRGPLFCSPSLSPPTIARDGDTTAGDLKKKIERCRIEI